MPTLLEQAIGQTPIVKTVKLSGPNGGTGWTQYDMSDGRVALRGPSVNMLPRWIVNLTPAGQVFRRAGGTTYRWSGWISQYY